MRNRFGCAFVAVWAVLASSPAAFSQQEFSQEAIPGFSGVPQRPTTLYDKLNAAGGKSAPAPARDLNGSWTGPLEPKLGTAAPLTPLGERRFKANTPDPFRAHSNDPWGTCDPFGFPRSTTNETRGVTFASLSNPDRVLILTQYQRVWRTVWMDGRELPKNVGAKGGPEPKWYGYSVGHWDGDHILVVNTTGVNDKTWVNRLGYPHSVDMRAEERYTRLDHDTMELSVTVDDPKTYTRPFVAVTNRFKWIPDQAEEEQFCVPSEMIDYIKIIAVPAGEENVTGAKK